MRKYTYKTFGLNINSEIRIPELPISSEEGDVTIRFGNVARSLSNYNSSGVCYQAAPGTFLLFLENVGRYLVQDGREIIVEPSPEANEEDIRLFLLGSAFGALLHQRGFYPLHGSSVGIKGRGIVFSGVSGSGKSTLAAAFRHKGYNIISDDISVISMKNRTPFIFPGYPQMKLWNDSLQKLGKDPEQFLKVRQRIDKYRVELKEGFQENPLPLSVIYTIAVMPVESSSIVPVKGIDKFNSLKNNTYRFNYLKGMNLAKGHFLFCSSLAQQVQVRRIVRSNRHFEPFELAELVEHDFEQLISGD